MADREGDARRAFVRAAQPIGGEPHTPTSAASCLKIQFETAVVGEVLLQRIGTADEATAAALFLLSEDASYVSGSQYAVDGGMMMR